MDIKNNTHSIELLAPAGDMEALKSAIASGADAVYFGTLLFNARIRAHNFDLDKAREAIGLCHAHGVKAFVTLNIAIYDKELSTVLEYVNALWSAGVDALIVSDIGVMRLIKRYFPELEIHASTQCTAHNIDGVKALELLGCSRVVVARELDKQSIRGICQGVNAEIEMFVHGAHCMSVSGQCLLSYAMGGRSGNRGECAQPCRLTYKIGAKNGYPLSLKDMSLAQHITEIIDTGASSLKIEGRMKSADYVGGVTRVWRRLLDGEKNATSSDMRELEALFSRQGFTDGYFKSRIDGSMLGIRSNEDKEQTRAHEGERLTLSKPKIDIYAKYILGKRAELTLKQGENEVSVLGDVVEEAISAPMSSEDVAKNLSKLGSTPYSLGELKIEKSDNIMARVSSINALRREGVDKLLYGDRKPKTVDYVYKKRTHRGKKIKTALFSRVEQIPENADYFDIVLIYADRYEKSALVNGICLPPVILDREWGEIEAKMEQARRDGVKYALVSNIGQIERAKALGFEIITDFRFNVFNTESSEYLEEAGATEIILSAELSLPQARDICGSLIAYGKIPLMTTHKCVLRDSVGCDKCKGYLRDRTGAELYCEGIFGHRNIIYNSVPIYMADKSAQIADFSWHFIFTDESRGECYNVIEAYKQGLTTSAKIRRIRV